MSLGNVVGGQEDDESLAVLQTRTPSNDEQITQVACSTGESSPLETFVTAPAALASKSSIDANSPTLSNLGLPLAFSLINSGINTSQYITARTTLSQLRTQPSLARQQREQWENERQLQQPVSTAKVGSSHQIENEVLRTVKPLEDHDIDMNQITHSPPFLPTTHSYLRFGKSNLRQTIISRQSSRMVPIQDRLTDHMEEQMVRWRPPPSSYQAEEILNGKHPYQRKKIASHEVIAAASEKAESKVESDGVISTDSAVNSIARSPFVNVDMITGASLTRNHKLQATFKEHNELPKGLKQEFKKEDIEVNDNSDSCSIQESNRFQLKPEPNSASASSSIIKKLNRDSTSEDDERDEDLNLVRCPGGIPNSTATVNADPMNREDLEQLAKDDPEPLNAIQFDQNPNDQLNPPFDNEDDELTCWAAFIEACQEIWKECIDICTCNCSCDEDLDPRINPYTVGP